MTFVKKYVAAIHKTDIYLKQFLWFFHQKLTRLCNKLIRLLKRKTDFSSNGSEYVADYKHGPAGLLLTIKQDPIVAERISVKYFKLWCKHQIWCTYSVVVIIQENNAGHAKFQYGRLFSRWLLWAILKSFYLPWDDSSWSEKIILMIHCAFWACKIYS